MLQSNDIINVLENPEAKSFIIRHLNDDVSALSLKYSSKTTFNLTICLQLIKLYQKAKHKLPKLCSVFPAMDERSYQQSTSELVAEFKSSLISGKNLLDLSAGLGVDDIAFAKVFDQILAIDPNADLNMMVNYNLKQLGISNIQRAENSAEEITDFNYDWVYLDPDRRSQESRLILLEDLHPNVLDFLPKLRKQSAKLALKLSPLFEIKELLKLISGIRSVYCISQSNELKEVFVLIDHESKVPSINAVELGANPYSVSATPADWGTHLIKNNTTPNYLYIPKSAVLKAHLEFKLARELGVWQMPGFLLFGSSALRKHEAFRRFKILEETSSGVRHIKSMLASRTVNQMNLLVKGSKMPMSYWEQKLKIRDGGADYLIILFGTINKAYLAQPL